MSTIFQSALEDYARWEWQMYLQHVEEGVEDSISLPQKERL